MKLCGDRYYEYLFALGTLISTLTGVEMFKKILDFGQVITKPGSVKTYKRIEAEIYALTKRRRPQFYMRTTDITAKVELPENIKIVMLGDNVSAVFELISPVPLEAENLDFIQELFWNILTTDFMAFMGTNGRACL
ncbi:unnamed protein product [Ilex paraguariensis]|uniref:Translation elongation factor EFTu/EF1A C-terminal domain-containing protein n=1 Tax=Ilex paraguariensis TaxID=185542 RepID=A0ABC8RSD9_9AQUA